MNKNVQYTYNSKNINQILAMNNYSERDLKNIVVHITSDLANPQLQSITLNEYNWKLSVMCSHTISSFRNCIAMIKDMHFNHFCIETIYGSTKRKEILVVANDINDDILDEYYSKMYADISQICPDCVFMIAAEEDIDFAIMPKFDIIAEV